MPRSGLAYLLTAIVRALFFPRKKKRPRRANRSSLDIESSQANLVADLRELAAKDTSGGVQVLIPSGRRSQPREVLFTPQPVAAELRIAPAFVSCAVRIDDVNYGFHAYVHPRANRLSKYWLYYAVTGPGNKDGTRGEFYITDEFSWIGQLPWSPLLVKTALRRWVKRNEVVEAIAAARAQLPDPPKKTP